MVTRHRRARRDNPENSNGSGGDVDAGDVTDATLPEAVPRNPDGTASEEGDVSEEQAQLIGSLSLESAAKNKGVARRLRDKAVGKKGVPWNVDDALEMFAHIRAVFASEYNSIIVHVTRIEPAPKVQLPPIPVVNLKDPQGLYEYVERHHGTQGPALYKVYWRAGAGHERGAASLYMPDKSAPPVVQVMSQPPQQQPPPYPGYPPYGYGAPPGAPPSYGAPSGWSPQAQPVQPQAQPQQGGGDRVFVISPPAQQPQAQPQPAAPLPPPAPVYMQPPPVPGAFDPQRALIEMMQVQNAQMMATIEKIAERLNQPQPPPPPPGFIALPSEQYPLPPGYVRVPGGMIPAPNMAMYAPQPTGVGAAPAQPPPVAYAAPAQAAPVVVQQAAPPPTIEQQITGTVGMMKGVVRGMGELQNLFASFAPQQQRPNDDFEPEPDEPPPPPNPLQTQDVGGITMAIDRATGKTNWAATLMGALPKLGDTFKSGLAEYQKLMDRQAAATSKTVNERIALANAVAAARGGPQQPALPQHQPLPQPPPQQQPQMAPPPQQQPQATPPQQRVPAVPPRKPPVMPVPIGPIWGTT